MRYLSIKNAITILCLLSNVPLAYASQPREKKRKTIEGEKPVQSVEDLPAKAQTLLEKARDVPVLDASYDVLAEESLWEYLPPQARFSLACQSRNYQGMLNFLFAHLPHKITSYEESILFIDNYKLITCQWHPQEGKGVIHIYDRTTNILKREIPFSFKPNTHGHVQHPLINKAGTRVITWLAVSEGLIVSLWDATTGTLVKNITQQVNGRVFMTEPPQFNDTETLLCIQYNSTFNVYDVTTGNCLYTSNNYRGVLSAFAGSSVLTGCGSKWVMHDSQQGTCTEVSLKAEFADLSADRLVLTKSDDTVQVLDAKTLISLHKLVGDFEGIVYGNYSATGHRLLLLSESKTGILDVEKGIWLVELEHPTLYPDEVIKLSPNGNTLALADESNVKIIDVDRSNCTHLLPHCLDSEHLSSIDRIAFNKTGELLLVMDFNEGFYYTVWVWHLETGICLGRVNLPEDGTNYDPVFSSDGTSIICGKGIWDVAPSLAVLAILRTLSNRQHRILTAIYEEIMTARLLVVRETNQALPTLESIGFFSAEQVQEIKTDLSQEWYDKVTKMTKRAQAAYNKGLRFDFTTYPQELQQAYDAIPPEIRTHFDPYILRHREVPVTD